MRGVFTVAEYKVATLELMMRVTLLLIVVQVVDKGILLLLVHHRSIPAQLRVAK